MGRRSLAVVTQEEEARAAVARHFRSLTDRRGVGVNLAQFQAQIHEQEMVNLLYGFAMDPTGDLAFRRLCILDVLNIARGPIAPWRHDGQTIDPAAQSATGKGSVGDDIEEAQRSAALLQKLDELVRLKVPVDKWPTEVREAAAEFSEAYRTVEG